MTPTRPVLRAATVLALVLVPVLVSLVADGYGQPRFDPDRLEDGVLGPADELESGLLGPADELETGLIGLDDPIFQVAPPGLRRNPSRPPPPRFDPRWLEPGLIGLDDPIFR